MTQNGKTEDHSQKGARGRFPSPQIFGLPIILISCWRQMWRRSVLRGTQTLIHTSTLFENCNSLCANDKLCRVLRSRSDAFNRETGATALVPVAGASGAQAHMGHAHRDGDDLWPTSRPPAPVEASNLTSVPQIPNSQKESSGTSNCLNC